MANKYPLLGSYTPLSKKDGYLPGCLEMAVEENANCFMFYTGAPQNTKRVPVTDFEIEQYKQNILKTNINPDNVIIHAPYVINLANTVKPELWSFGKQFLIDEIKRAEAIGVKTIVLHPGSAVGAADKDAMDQLIKGLNDVFEAKPAGIRIALETMAGNGSQIGKTFEQLAYIINGVEDDTDLGVCVDTCHIYDAGYDIVNDWDGVKEQFNKTIGKDKLFCFHLNDSKFGLDSHKDRHANIGYGKIGLKALQTILNDEEYKDAPKILETPYINGYAPYKYEIEELLTGKPIDFVSTLEKK